VKRAGGGADAGACVCKCVRSTWYLLAEIVFRKCQVKVITEIRKNESGDRIKVERTVKVIHALSL